MARSDGKVAGCKHYASKTIAQETLPSRHARTSITELDQFNRMRGVYGKNAKNPLDEMTPIAAVIKAI